MNLRSMLHQRRQREHLYSTASFWDSKAIAYQDEAVSMWPNVTLDRLYEREQLRFLDRVVPSLRGATALDVGCGTGRITRYLGRRGARAVGIDFSAGAIDIARAQSADDNIDYRLHSVFELDDERRYDVITSFGSLTVACRDRDDLVDALSRIRSAIKDGGTLALIEPIHAGFVHRVLNMDLAAFCDALELSGFRVREVVELHFWPTRFLLAFVRWPGWITAPVYHLGQLLLRVPVLRHLGDYKGVHAVPVAA